jgi:hypothetical protein
MFLSRAEMHSESKHNREMERRSIGLLVFTYADATLSILVC